MKKKLKKNQIIITALAFMIAVAGYVSYTRSNLDGKAAAQAFRKTLMRFQTIRL